MQTPIETLIIDMLASNLPSRVLREAELEELRRGAKLADVALEYLGLRTISVDGDGEMPLRVVASHSPRDSWREALVLPEGDRPIGILINTADAGPLVLVHEVFDSFAEPEKELVRRYAALAVRGEPHEAIVAALRAGNVGEAGFTQALRAARRTVRSLDPTVLFSPDGATRVQLGSLSRTTKDILREGLQGDHLFIVPASLFEGKTNYADIEFLVYLNFFLRQKTRTRIVGTSRQRHVLHRLLTLTLFGLFDPAAPEPPSFEKLAEAYGVGSRETYHFLRTAHELYGARRDGSPESPLLGIDDYVDFVALDGEATVIPLPSAEVRVAPSGRGFDVSHRAARRPVEREATRGGDAAAAAPARPHRAPRGDPVRERPAAIRGHTARHQPRLRRAWRLYQLHHLGRRQGHPRRSILRSARLPRPDRGRGGGCALRVPDSTSTPTTTVGSSRSW